MLRKRSFLKAGFALKAAARLLDRLRWLSITPLAFPVVPEV